MRYVENSNSPSNIYTERYKYESRHLDSPYSSNKHNRQIQCPNTGIDCIGSRLLQRGTPDTITYNQLTEPEREISMALHVYWQELLSHMSIITRKILATYTNKST
jgi:hypothetical protein